MQFVFADALGDVNDPSDIRQRHALVLSMLNWKRFDWLERFKEEMMAADYKPWTGVHSPFGTKEGPNGRPID